VDDEVHHIRVPGPAGLDALCAAAPHQAGATGSLGDAKPRSRLGLISTCGSWTIARDVNWQSQLACSFSSPSCCYWRRDWSQRLIALAMAKGPIGTAEVARHGRPHPLEIAGLVVVGAVTLVPFVHCLPWRHD
jgi:hypothetical protein